MCECKSFKGNHLQIFDGMSVLEQVAHMQIEDALHKVFDEEATQCCFFLADINGPCYK